MVDRLSPVMGRVRLGKKGRNGLALTFIFTIIVLGRPSVKRLFGIS